MKTAILAVLLAAAGAVSPVQGAEVFKAIAKGVSAAAAGAKVERVAVLPFIASNGQHPEDGVVMAERLIGTLVQHGKVRVVEREMLNSIMKEHYLTTSGIVSPEGRRQIGRVLAVDAIVTGSFVSFGRRAAVNARLIHVETGDILYAQTRELSIDWFDAYPLASPFASLLAGDEGPLGCRDYQAQLERLERELLDLKTRYWMTQSALP
ncbi:MAG: hypothetical protein HY554_11810 [Elusimicrobia bacterium]|nr:hypothetical protein [Elusimicrobiota bacterium]